MKSDGCDVVADLTESMRGEWGGDIDLGDGKLIKQFEEYSDLIPSVKVMCRQLANSVERSRTLFDFGIVKKSLVDGLEFIPEGI